MLYEKITGAKLDLNFDDEEITNSNEEKGKLKLLQNNSEEEIKDSIPDIIPNYDTKYIYGLKMKIKKEKS